MSPKCFTMAAIQRYSLLLSRTLNKWLAIRDTIFNIHWSGYSAVWLLHGWCQVKLLPFGACSVYTIQPCLSFVSSHLKPHTLSACVFSCNMPSALLAEWRGSFACYSSNIGVEWILRWESAQKVDLSEDISPAAPARPWRPFDHKSGAQPPSYSHSPCI